MAMEFERKLAIPAEVKEMYPLTGKMRETVETRNAKIKRIFEGKDDRLYSSSVPARQTTKTA